MSSDHVDPDTPEERDDQLAAPDGAVVEAVLASLDTVRSADPTGVCGGVLDVMAVLSGAGVRRDLLHAAGQGGALVGGRRVAAALVDQAVDRLAGCSLLAVSVDGQVITAHQMVTSVLRDGLARRKRLAAVCRATAAVLETRAHALAGSPDRAAAGDIPRQVVALAEAAVGQADDQLARVLLRLRFLALCHLIELGDSAQAIAVGEPLAADLERLLGAGHPDTLNAQNSLAAAYQAAGRVDEAIPLSQQHPGRPSAAAGSRPSRHTDFAEQPSGRLSGCRPDYRGDAAVRNDPSRSRVAAGSRPPQHAELTRQPRPRLSGCGQDHQGDPAAAADHGRPGTGPGPQSPRHRNLTE